MSKANKVEPETAQSRNAKIIEEALSEMPPALRKVCEKIQSQLSKNVLDNVRVKWNIGGIILAARQDEATYGSRALDQLAIALQISSPELHFLSRFHESFEKEQLQNLMAQKMANGSPLTLCHFREVMVLPDADREEYLQHAIDNSLSYRQLAQEISEVVDRQQRRSRDVVPPRTLNQGIKQISTYSDQMLLRQSVWEEAIFDDLDKISASSCNDKLLEKVTTLRDQQAQLALMAQNNVTRSDSVIRRIRRITGAVFTAPVSEDEDSDEERPKFAKAPAVKRAKRKARRANSRQMAKA